MKKAFVNGLVAAGVIALSGVLSVASSTAADAVKERVIALKDGGRVELRSDGTTGHYDAAGVPVPMQDGEIMIASDGTRILMKGDAMWRQIIELAAINYALASRLPWRGSDANGRSIELADGGRIVLRKDGTMARFDAAGRHVAMGDGTTMTAKDGTRILVKNDTLWSLLFDSGPTPRDRR